MILAAGRGERLRPLTDRIPKPLAQVGGKPLILHQLHWLAEAGFHDVVINLHHLGTQIEELLGDGGELGLRIHYSRENELLDTGGGIVKALPLLGDGFFLLVNGDIFTTFPLSKLPSELPDGVDMHLLLTPTPAFRDRGDFEFSDGRILGRGGSHVYCGICIIRASLFAGRAVKPFSLRDDLFEALRDGRLSAQVWDGYWTDIGTLDQLESVNAYLSS
jgi:MurNAc alpha-1-phosphate uridylyltransferase